jgi:hypothetical protein
VGVVGVVIDNKLCAVVYLRRNGHFKMASLFKVGLVVWMKFCRLLSIIASIEYLRRQIEESFTSCIKGLIRKFTEIHILNHRHLIVSLEKYMPPPLPYFKVNICPLPLPYFCLRIYSIDAIMQSKRQNFIQTTKPTLNKLAILKWPFLLRYTTAHSLLSITTVLQNLKHMLYNVNWSVQQTTFSWMVNSWPESQNE